MISLVKMSIKLLLRNKGFLFFLLVTPIVSTFILSIKMDTAIIGSENNKNVISLQVFQTKAEWSKK